jgi:2-amino-4-hydroxy-6-hydroxymethyldihydropteridine diphosphokinase
MPLHTVYFSLGSNLRDRQANLRNALERMNEQRIRITAQSSLYETEPQDYKAQPWFLNLVARGETSRFPMQLLAATQKIERELGRSRASETVNKGPRVIDIDILLFDARTIDVPLLKVPHPRMLERRFVLEPLLEIAPELRHPQTKRPFREYLGGVVLQTVRKV